MRKAKAQEKIPVHPGTIISEIMAQRKLTVDSLSVSLKVEIQLFEEFLQGRASIDEKFSRELSRLFGRTSREWQKLQKDYDDYMAEHQKNDPAQSAV